MKRRFDPHVPARAIGALAWGAVGRARIEHLSIDTLEVARLFVRGQSGPDGQ